MKFIFRYGGFEFWSDSVLKWWFFALRVLILVWTVVGWRLLLLSARVLTANCLVYVNGKTLLVAADSESLSLNYHVAAVAFTHFTIIELNVNQPTDRSKCRQFNALQFDNLHFHQDYFIIILNLNLESFLSNFIIIKNKHWQLLMFAI